MNALHEIDLFVALGRTLSFKAAAHTLGIPTSTLSRRIVRFERELGLQLFVRTTRRVELTPIAKEYLTRCEAIVEDATEARAQVLGSIAEPSGRLRVSMEVDVGANLIAPAIAELHRRYPKMTIDLDLSPRRVDLIAEGFDVAVRIGDLPDSSLIVRTVASLTVGLYASKRYLAAHGEPMKPADLHDHCRLHLLHQHDKGMWLLRSGKKRATIESRGGLVLANNMTMLRSLMRLGMGVTVMDSVMADEDVRRGRIRRVLPDWHLPPVPVSILTPSRLIPAKTRAFIELVSAELAKR